MSVTSAPLSVRLSADERALIEAAASHARTSVSDFMRRTSIEAAELALMDRRIVTIPAADWERFEAWANTPGEKVPALQALADRVPAWKV